LLLINAVAVAAGLALFLRRYQARSVNGRHFYQLLKYGRMQASGLIKKLGIPLRQLIRNDKTLSEEEFMTIPSPRACMTVADLQVGMTEEEVYSVQHEDAVRLSEISGDWNPAHHDEAYAI
jgi:hypothetical protein